MAKKTRQYAAYFIKTHVEDGERAGVWVEVEAVDIAVAQKKAKQIAKKLQAKNKKWKWQMHKIRRGTV